MQRRPVLQIRSLSLELVGQFQNSPPSVTPPTHSHYGYLSHIRGVSAYSGATQNETTALFTRLRQPSMLHHRRVAFRLAS